VLWKGASLSGAGKRWRERGVGRRRDGQVAEQGEKEED